MRFSVKRTDNDKDMIEEYQLRVLPETAANEQALRRYVAREKGKDERTLTAIRAETQYRRPPTHDIRQLEGTGVCQ